jgi:PAS domain S-box-containing protein
MNTFKNISIKNKLIIIIISTSIIALVAGLSAYLIIDMVKVRNEMKKNAILNATLVGQYAAAPLLFGYKEEVTEVLTKLSAIPSVLDACLYSPNSEEIFATYHNTPSTSFRFPPLQKDNATFKAGYLQIFYTVRYKEQNCGTIYLRISSIAIHEKFRNSLLIMAILVVLLLITVYIIASRLQKIISFPILNLAELTATISQNQDFTVQLKQQGNDEVGILYQQFNHLLSQLLKRQNERDEAEKKIKESETHFRYLFEQNPAILLIYELSSLTMLAVNDAFIKHYGYSKAEILSMKLTDLYTENEKEAISNLAEKLVGLNYVGEWHHLKKDGAKITIEVSSHGVTYEGRQARIAVINDITERKLAEKALQESEVKYRRIVDTANEGIWTLDQDGRTTVVNARLVEILGYQDVEMVIGRLVTDFMCEEDLPDHRKRMENRRQGLSETYERRFRRNDGRAVWTLVSGSSVLDDEQQFVGTIGMITDITERKLAEQEILKLNSELENRVIERTAQLESANKELEAFSYSVSHDLRAPLRHVSGYLELLTKRNYEQLDDKGKHYMQSISEASNQMGVLIDDLLNFSRAGRMEMKLDNMDMNKAIKDALAMLEQETKGRTIEWIQAPMPNVYADYAMVRQVWVNLLSNAIKYTRKCDIATIEIGSISDASENIFFVRDNGAGFDMNYAQKLFGVFQRLHSMEDFEGTGIGLANVRQVIKRHKGRTWAEGETDTGATFYFSIPKITGE